MKLDKKKLSNIEINKYSAGMEIIIFSKKISILKIPLIIIILIWLFCEIINLYVLTGSDIQIGDRVGKNLLSKENIGIVIFVSIGWTIGGFYLVKYFLWQFYGKERIFLTRKSLEVIKYYYKIKRGQEYLIDNIKKFFLNTDILVSSKIGSILDYSATPQGKVSFYYNGDKKDICLGIDEIDAKRIVVELNNFLHS
jgi:hypothetical protein